MEITIFLVKGHSIYTKDFTIEERLGTLKTKLKNQVKNLPYRGFSIMKVQRIQELL